MRYWYIELEPTILYKTRREANRELSMYLYMGWKTCVREVLK